MFTAITRRTFLATGAIATLAVVARHEVMRSDSRPAPTGPVYGRGGRHGISPGTPAAPSRGEVVLLDGRVIEATHVHGLGIEAGKSLLVSPAADGSWSILYAEV